MDVFVQVEFIFHFLLMIFKSMNSNRIDGLMDGALATSAVDCALSPSRVNPKYMVLLRYAVIYHNKTQSMLV